MQPIWIEAVIHADETTTPQDAAAAVLPSSARIIQACTLDEAESAMNAAAAALSDRIAEGRRMVQVLAGLIDNQIVTPDEAVESLRNIVKWFTNDD